MTEKWKFMAFRVSFLLEVHIQQGYLTEKTLECYWKKENLTFQNKEIHNGCTEMKNYIVAGFIK